MEDAELLLGFVNAVAKPAYHVPPPPPPPSAPPVAPPSAPPVALQQAPEVTEEAVPLVHESLPVEEVIVEETIVEESAAQDSAPVQELKVERDPPRLDPHIDHQLELDDVPHDEVQALPEHKVPDEQSQPEITNERPAQLAASGRPDPDSQTPPSSSVPVDTKDSLQMSETKTRVYKGWPKGKPRGPRQVQYAKRGTKTKKTQSDGGTGQGSVSGSAGSPTLSNADMTMENGEEGSQLGDVSQEQDEIIAAGTEHNGSEMTFDDMLDPELLSTAQASISLVAAVSAVAATPIQVGTTSTPEPRPRSRGTNSQTVVISDDLCASCQNARTSDLQDFWVSCNGCKSWFHHTCVGFQTEREVKDVDKFYCKSCEPRFGATTCKLGSLIPVAVS
jgi:hypothetical protein